MDAGPERSPALALHCHHDDPVLTWALPEVVVGAVGVAVAVAVAGVGVVVAVVVLLDPDVDPVTAAVVTPEAVDEPALLAAATEARPTVAMTLATAVPIVSSRSRPIARSRWAAVSRCADFTSDYLRRGPSPERPFGTVTRSLVGPQDRRTGPRTQERSVRRCRVCDNLALVGCGLEVLRSAEGPRPIPRSRRTRWSRPVPGE